MTRSVLFIGLTNRGGMAHYAHEFCASLVRNGHRVVLVCLGVFEVPEPFRNYEVIEVPHSAARGRLGKGVSFLSAGLASLSVIKALKPDVVFMNGYQPLMGYPLAVLRPAGVPLCCIQHEVEPRVGDRTIGLWQRRFYQRTSAMIVHRHTRSQELLVGKYGVRVPVLLIDLGLYETDLFGRQASGTNEEKRTLLSFGAVREDKGLDVLVRAYPGRRACRGLRLVIAGQAKGAYREFFSSVIAGRDDVTWIDDYVPLHATGRLYRDAAFAVLPFVECTQSASLRLAMFFETPVIASAIGEIPEFIGRHEVGMLCPPGDVAALRAAVILMSHDANRRSAYVENIRRLNTDSGLSWRRITGSLLAELEQRNVIGTEALV